MADLLAVPLQPKCEDAAEAILATLDRVEAAGDCTEDEARQLVGWFSHPRKGIRRRAANAIAAAIDHGRISPADCESQLDSDDPAVRWAAAFALARAGRTTPRVIEVALEQFDAPDGDVRWAAAAILTPVARVIEDLRLRLRDLATSGAATTRKMALLVLADAGERDLDLYVRALRDNDGYVRLAALRALGRIGNGSPSVVDALLAVAANDSDERIRRAADAIAARLATVAAKE